MSTEFEQQFRLVDEMRPGRPFWGLPWELSAGLRQERACRRLGLLR